VELAAGKFLETETEKCEQEVPLLMTAGKPRSSRLVKFKRARIMNLFRPKGFTAKGPGHGDVFMPLNKGSN